jgi:hypothetical protein
MHPVLKRNFEMFSPCDWLAALTAHIPNAGEHLVRYYGWYSNVNRGKRHKVARDEGNASPIEACSEVPNAAAKCAWARLSKQVSQVDPLVCPHCGSGMRIIAFIEQPAVIEIPQDICRTADPLAVPVVQIIVVFASLDPNDSGVESVEECGLAAGWRRAGGKRRNAAISG